MVTETEDPLEALIPEMEETAEKPIEEEFIPPTPLSELAEESVLEAVQEDTQKPVEEDVLEAEEAEPVVHCQVRTCSRRNCERRRRRRFCNSCPILRIRR